MKTRVITFHYILHDTEGNLIDSSEGKAPLSYLEGVGHIISGLEEEMKKMETGEKRKINVSAENAYGIKDPDLIFDVPRSQFPPNEDLQIGMMFQTDEPDKVFTITELQEESVIVDGNHPLAGVNLIFDVELTGIREATEEEISHGHVHGEDGHHHH
ncbi:FKBP-type peptidyl-prolyl cis-trans isomerase [Leptospira borgpetersenii]|uniref:Peptidyl-prolyl cis-trans isomerase n=1 Tax=Leptospira borgpetersenii serovar Pomona str. 200901868 TaxID=1192866 RepID=M6WTF6_LEPBO|nr:peptidylprolyl isomerase [Leptospira borgpetersenii]EMO65033.1 peptidyl-prolyl cis-trans isomerase, FKBP-type [Leptospira borgpetersenii serovar Pomona str. 200901868]MBE8363364.1 peptidylprolyl isomerase [Leptospira borgpetersenii serovar Balcanica]MBE8368257.1 peptidylprolyl isomerase [Leptospira borgpetersenii serovar Balcanica]MBE8400111.1 peptidylprolyl isomerase [Leptospira borgpetersenii serovar Tarassovi]MBE8404791.1 peptidylprolyl isomerase [Leptospira borgpetersenii serovar Tarass